MPPIYSNYSETQPRCYLGTKSLLRHQINITHHAGVMRLSVTPAFFYFLEQSGRISAHSAQLISAFGFALSARISHRTMSPGIRAKGERTSHNSPHTELLGQKKGPARALLGEVEDSCRRQREPADEPIH